MKKNTMQYCNPCTAHSFHQPLYITDTVKKCVTRCRNTYKTTMNDISIMDSELLLSRKIIMLPVREIFAERKNNAGLIAGLSSEFAYFAACMPACMEPIVILRKYQACHRSGEGDGGGDLRCGSILPGGQHVQAHCGACKSVPLSV